MVSTASRTMCQYMAMHYGVKCISLGGAVIVYITVHRILLYHIMFPDGRATLCGCRTCGLTRCTSYVAVLYYAMRHHKPHAMI